MPISVVSICSNVPAQKPYLLNQLIGTDQQRGWDGETDNFGRLEVPSRWGCYHAPPLTDPYVPISSIRFFTGELRSQLCIDGRSGPLATGAALGGRGSDPKQVVAADPAVAAICARSLRPHTRTGAVVEDFPICHSRHSGRASSEPNGRAGHE